MATLAGAQGGAPLASIEQRERSFFMAAGRAGAGVHFPVHPFYSDQSVVDAEQYVYL